MPLSKIEILFIETRKIKIDENERFSVVETMIQRNFHIERSLRKFIRHERNEWVSVDRRDHDSVFTRTGKKHFNGPINRL